MDIVWLGHSCFRIRGKDAAIVTDPFDRTLGYPQRKPSATIVTVSHSHPQHSFVEGVAGSPKVISAPGEYEISNVFIFGVPTFHDREQGKALGKNVVFLIEIEDVKVCHLGDLGHVLTTEQVEEVGDVDVLLVPVGGGTTLAAPDATEVISLLEPKLVIPMHFKTDAITRELDTVDRFLKEMAVKEAMPQPRLTVSRSTLPTETRVIVLDYEPKTASRDAAAPQAPEASDSNLPPG